jgi:mono/diheme cytochrome c family protein
MLKRLLAAGLLLALIIVGGAWLWANRHPALPAINPPGPASFSRSLVEEGEVLAAVGNCVVCHTTSGGAPLSGGRAFETPFGTLHASNITPHPDRGIGRWSEEAFARAMRQGIARSGELLYPAFPYDHFAIVSDDDIRALYAWVMSQAPSDAASPPNRMRFPFDRRELLAFWQVLYANGTPFRPNPERSDDWNRGAYLVEGLGHCGACHTPRTALGGLDSNRHFGGALLGYGWYAPALDRSSPALIPWTADALVNYLLDGWDIDHGIADGPMTPVVDNLGLLPEEDVYAIAEYLLTFLPQPEVDRAALRAAAVAREFPVEAPADPGLARGHAIFARSCANCHRQGTQTVPLALTPTLRAPNSANLIAVVREGIVPPQGTPDRTMPSFPTLTSAELRDLAAFMRAQFTDLPSWSDLPSGG